MAKRARAYGPPFADRALPPAVFDAALKFTEGNVDAAVGLVGYLFGPEDLRDLCYRWAIHAITEEQIAALRREGRL